MNVLSITGQVIGLIAAAVMIASFQFKDNRKLFAAQICSTVLFTLHYMFLGLGGDGGAFAGMAQNFGGIVFRVILILSGRFKKLKSPLVLAAVCAYSAVVAALTYDPGNIIYLLPMIGSILCMGALWTDDRNAIRIVQFTATSPSWLIYNISTHSISGVITEVFNLVSIIVFYVRMIIKKQKEKKLEGAEDEKSENNGPREL
ncbi:MAG: YgjV family protein [Clostridia bacterium]|nr:YgjV family protein [Clostridia bacterium]